MPRTKLNLQGRRGWPDQCYWVPGGRPLLVEFKEVGEEPTKLQEHIHRELKKNGYQVEVHYEAATAIAAVRARLDAGAVPNRGREVLARPRVRRPVSPTRAKKD